MFELKTTMQKVLLKSFPMNGRVNNLKFLGNICVPPAFGVSGMRMVEEKNPEILQIVTSVRT
jgi:hypothetical protein